MKVLFITPGPITWASSRMRAYWPARYMGADVIEVKARQAVADYHAYIFVKTGDAHFMQSALDRGRQVWMDMCDPAWWWEPQKTLELAHHATGIVASNPALAADFNQFVLESGEAGGLPVARVIPDRLELSHFEKVRTHRETSPIKFIWFGAGQNRISLIGAIANLERLKANGYDIELTIFDDAPEWNITDDFPVHFVRWTLDTENEVIASHDIAVLPPYPGPWGKVKSNNRALTARLCHLPVTDGYDYHTLEELTASAAARALTLLAQAQDTSIDEIDVRRTADEWTELLNV